MAYERPGRTLLAANWFVRKLGVKPTLTVRGRRSGRPRTVPVNVLDHEGRRYLVSPRGDTEWARNLRAAGEGELRSRGGREPVTATEVDEEARPALIDAYRARWERETRTYWKALPDPADHPVFEIVRTPAPSA